GEVRQLAEREVDLRRRAAEAETLDRLDELVRQVLFAHQLQEGAARIRARDHDFRADLFATLEHHAFGSPSRNEYPGHRSFRTNLRARGLRGGGNRRAHRTIATFREAPGAEHAVELA